MCAVEFERLIVRSQVVAPLIGLIIRFVVKRKGRDIRVCLLCCPLNKVKHPRGR